MSNLKYIGKNILNHDLILKKGDVSGSLASTGSFGHLVVGGDIGLVEDQRIYFEADKATYIESHASDSLRAVVNDRQMLILDEDTGNRAVFGNGTKVYIGADNNKQPDKELVVDGDISGSATSTGSFGRVEASRVNATDATFTNEIRLEDGLLAPAVGDDIHLGPALSTTPKIRFGTTSWGDYIGLESYWTVHSTNANEGFKFKTENGGSDIIFQLNGQNQSSQAGGRSANFKGTIAPMSNLGSGLGTTSYRFSELVVNHVSASGNISASSFIGIFNGALSGSAQIASNISGAFAVASASFAADILTNSSSFSTRITNDSSSFSTRVTRNEGTGSKILAGELEFTNITGSGHISMSLSSTGSFGRVSATTLGGHSPLLIDSIVTASSAIQFDGKVFFETGSIEGDLHVRTNADLMRIGKSTSGIIVSGSEEVSRFATGSDGSIIDLGFTVIDEDGNVVLAGDGDGIHIDSNNYWYNNKYVKFGDGRDYYFDYNNKTLKYSGEVIAKTGSFGGEMYISSPTGSMFIGKFTGGIPTSGSDPISRFATGSDGSIIDLGFTTTDEDGETVFLSTGDGIYLDDTNYWYTTGHFKLGDADNYIHWNTSNLTISGTFSGDGSGLSGLPQSFTNVTSSGDALFQSDVKIDGRLTAQEIHTEIESASIIFTSGSTIFGNSIDDTHTFTGSMFLTGSISASVFRGDGSQLTGITSFAGAAGTETVFSGSATSTGSFGRVEITSGKVLGDSTGGVTTPFSVIGGTGTSAGGLQFGAYNADFGGIWPAGVTPAASNYAFVARNGRTVLNTTTDIGLYKDDATVLLFANSTGVAIGGNSLTPSYKLDITGTGRFTGDLTLGGNVVGDDATNISGVNDITALGDISGSLTSTGSFGSITAAGTGVSSIAGDFGIGTVNPNISGVTKAVTVNGSGAVIYELATGGTRKGNMYHDGSTSMSITNNANGTLTLGTNNSARLTIAAAGDVTLTHDLTTPNISVAGNITHTDNTTTKIAFDTNEVQMFSNNNERLKVADGVVNVIAMLSGSGEVEFRKSLLVDQNITGSGNLEIAGNISGSATSTGSFGKLFVGGSEVTAGGGGSAFPFTGSATISGSLTVSNVDGKVFEVTSELTGSLFSVSTISGIPALETFDDYRTVGRFERPMRTHTTNFTASALHGGYYNIVSASLTCSIVHPDTASVAIGTEFEFFVKDDGGRGLLFETQSMGTTQVLSKNGNMQLAGQYSGATLKKVDTDTWHLVGDLT